MQAKDSFDVPPRLSARRGTNKCKRSAKTARQKETKTTSQRLLLPPGERNTHLRAIKKCLWKNSKALWVIQR